jgi:hypothetical protein
MTHVKPTGATAMTKDQAKKELTTEAAEFIRCHGTIGVSGDSLSCYGHTFDKQEVNDIVTAAFDEALQP